MKCALEKHGKRKGAVEPSRQRKSAPKKTAAAKACPAKRKPIPAAVRREVWKRDGGQCAWRSEDGRRCGSTWKLELDHIVPAALGGASTVENLRVCCQAHNGLHAEHVFGRGHMEPFRHKGPRAVEVTAAGGSGAGAGSVRSGLMGDEIDRAMGDTR